MEYDKLKEKVKMLGFRVTKDVKGKRVKLTKKELAAKLPKKMKAQPSLENQAKSAKKFIKVCKMVLREAEPTQPRAPRVVQQPVRMSPRRAAPPPPPPPPGVSQNPRAALLADLKANLIKRGLAKN
uniref:Uncharacterized protein n=1 Tax=Ostreococcus mediterraneus virus 2 TaxID=2726183 RepID=A0A6H1QW93_9PHYC|nr:hypothetical protein orf00270 [Ostreococcus mediterraneus virus 2]